MFKLIMAVLPKGKVEVLMPVIKNIGIFGATMFEGKGLCAKEGKNITGICKDSSREILLILTSKANKKEIIDALVKQGNLKDPGEGIVFVMNVSEVIG